MCRRIDCATCGRPTFAGCGAHIEQVLGDVPREQRCSCRADSAKAREKGDASPSTEKTTAKKSWLDTILGR